MSYTQKMFYKLSTDHRDVRLGLKTPHEECEPLVLTSLFLPSHSLGGVLQGACPCTDINQCAGKKWKCINIPLAIARWINIFLLHSPHYLLDKTNRGQVNGFFSYAVACSTTPHFNHSRTTFIFSFLSNMYALKQMHVNSLLSVNFLIDSISWHITKLSSQVFPQMNLSSYLLYVSWEHSRPHDSEINNWNFHMYTYKYFLLFKNWLYWNTNYKLTKTYSK